MAFRASETNTHLFVRERLAVLYSDEKERAQRHCGYSKESPKTGNPNPPCRMHLRLPITNAMDSNGFRKNPGNATGLLNVGRVSQSASHVDYRAMLFGRFLTVGIERGGRCALRTAPPGPTTILTSAWIPQGYNDF